MEFPLIEIVLGESYWDSFVKIEGHLVFCSKLKIEIDPQNGKNYYEIHLPLTLEGKIAKIVDDAPASIGEETFVLKAERNYSRRMEDPLKDKESCFATNAYEVLNLL